MMQHILSSLIPFLFGIWIHLLLKVRDYKKVAELNPDPNIKFSLKDFIEKEFINYLVLISSGIALILYFPGFLTGHSISIKAESGKVLYEMSADVFRAPLYFLLGNSGSSGVLSVFGKYKKLIFKQILPEDEKRD